MSTTIPFPQVVRKSRARGFIDETDDTHGYDVPDQDPDGDGEGESERVSTEKNFSASAATSSAATYVGFRSSQALSGFFNTSVLDLVQIHRCRIRLDGWFRSNRHSSRVFCAPVTTD